MPRVCRTPSTTCAAASDRLPGSRRSARRARKCLVSSRRSAFDHSTRASASPTASGSWLEAGHVAAGPVASRPSPPWLPRVEPVETTHGSNSGPQLSIAWCPRRRLVGVAFPRPALLSCRLLHMRLRFRDGHPFPTSSIVCLNPRTYVPTRPAPLLRPPPVPDAGWGARAAPRCSGACMPHPSQVCTESAGPPVVEVDPGDPEAGSTQAQALAAADSTGVRRHRSLEPTSPGLSRTASRVEHG